MSQAFLAVSAALLLLVLARPRCHGRRRAVLGFMVAAHLG